MLVALGMLAKQGLKRFRVWLQTGRYTFKTEESKEEEEHVQGSRIELYPGIELIDHHYLPSGILRLKDDL